MKAMFVLTMLNLGMTTGVLITQHYYILAAVMVAVGCIVCRMYRRHNKNQNIGDERER